MQNHEGPLIVGAGMPLIRELRRLRAEHDALVTLSCFLTDIVTAAEAPRPTELASVRGMLRDTLVRHLKCEDWALYPRLQVADDAALSTMATRFADEMGCLAEAFLAYDGDWTPMRAEADWAGFCEATIAILQALGERIEREETELYPAAERIFGPEAVIVAARHARAA